MASINNIDGFVHTIADKPLWRGAVQVHPLGKERPDRLTEFVQIIEQKHRLVNELLERLGTAQTETNHGSTGWTATLETSKATTTNERSAAGSWRSPQPVFNSTHTHGPDPERPRNSTAISTVQRCWRYCEGRSRPSVVPRHHGHPPLTLADANRPEPCQLAHRRRNCDLGKGTEVNAV